MVVAPLSHSFGFDGHLTTPSGGKLPEESYARFVETSPDATTDEIRERWERDGYLYVKGLLKPENVRALRTKFFAETAHLGLLEPGTDPKDAIFAKCPHAVETYLHPGSLRPGKVSYDAEKSQKYFEACVAAQRSEWFHKFQTQPEMTDFIKRLTGWDELHLLKRQLLRAAMPQGDTTIIHYDQLYFRHGPPKFVTCWAPLQDTSPDMGGLMYLSDSASIGEDMEKNFNARAQHMSDSERKSAFNANMMARGAISNDAGQFAKEVNRKWIMADFKEGDVVFHNPFIIHGACVNTTDRVMIHTDTRYVNPADGFDKRWTVFWDPNNDVTDPVLKKAESTIA
ncbi:hypothetical protein JCM24511_07982 [Saitozyma sp. JCM 24511]|nr:hypothetical protein JCM24511_07982 [Saitozyma sp. JCM 24511]